jgi:hypothetical protein
LLRIFKTITGLGLAAIAESESGRRNWFLQPNCPEEQILQRQQNEPDPVDQEASNDENIAIVASSQ